MLDKAKLALRITSSHFDEEIQDIIDACYLDLQISGAKEAKLTGTYDKLVQRAVLLYVKAQFGLDNKDSEKYQKSYEAIKRNITLSQEFLT